MNPAFSVIFFTSASGAGYGLLIMLGLTQLLGQQTASTLFMLSAIAIAVALVSAGLLSSTFHLGHPERAWRALSQWRSSWLSREGVFAIVTFFPIIGFAAGLQSGSSLLMPAALCMVIFCVLTVYCTAMIYASLKTIHAWCNHWVLAAYAILALMSGSLLLNALVLISAAEHQTLLYTTLVLIAAAFVIKLGYWNFLKHSKALSNVNTATGLSGKVNLVQSPHSQENYLMKEMGYQLARKHAEKLRRLSMLFAFVLPFVFTLVILLVDSGLIDITMGIMAVISVIPGILIERWLFFAEARHTVMLYYGTGKK